MLINHELSEKSYQETRYSILWLLLKLWTRNPFEIYSFIAFRTTDQEHRTFFKNTKDNTF
jgi:hypothetical protein